MKIEEVIKNRRTIRKYNRKALQKKDLVKILEAARWAPSVHNAQPWRFIVLRKRSLIEAIGNILIAKCRNLLSGFNVVLKETAQIIFEAPVVVVVYDTCELSSRMKKFEEPYFFVTKVSEYQSISASIENSLLMAHCLGIGSAWLTSPLFCDKEIMSFLKLNGSLVAILTFGYPAERVQFPARKSLKNIVEYRL